MRIFKKKGTVMFMILILIFSMLPIGVFAEEENVGEKVVVHTELLDEDNNVLENITFFTHETYVLKNPKIKVYFNDGSDEILDVKSAEILNGDLIGIEKEETSTDVFYKISSNHKATSSTDIYFSSEKYVVVLSVFIKLDTFRFIDPNTNDFIEFPNTPVVEFIIGETVLFNPYVKFESGREGYLSEFDNVTIEGDENVDEFFREAQNWVNFNKVDEGWEISVDEEKDIGLSIPFEVVLDGVKTLNHYHMIRVSVYNQQKLDDLYVGEVRKFDPLLPNILKQEYEPLSEFVKTFDTSIKYDENDIEIFEQNGHYYIRGLKDTTNREYTKIELSFKTDSGRLMKQYVTVKVIRKLVERDDPVEVEPIEEENSIPLVPLEPATPHTDEEEPVSDEEEENSIPLIPLEPSKTIKKEQNKVEVKEEKELEKEDLVQTSSFNYNILYVIATLTLLGGLAIVVLNIRKRI